MADDEAAAGEGVMADASQIPGTGDAAPSAGGEGQEAGASAQGGDGTAGTSTGRSGSPGGASGIPGAAGGESRGDGPAGIPGGQGTLTRAEQVAILDAELERGAGEFDNMILEEQTAAREKARDKGDPQERGGGSGGASAGDSDADADSDSGVIASAGGYGAGGGMGGGSRRDKMPQDTAKYPPPKDIPDGNNDDVVARQLREAAMREPDPAVRERLWAEYRKYKGIDQP